MSSNTLFMTFTELIAIAALATRSSGASRLSAGGTPESHPIRAIEHQRRAILYAIHDLNRTQGWHVFC
ncbi:hypothetical protein [Polaromonas jejuensis]|uniref:hypothetical protein n=1 Tax=Polaromonas jejuensis TaxID=457502 RepID=UPI001471167C|nr:hypothetical protein [Polaromonas jejuensis]